MGFNPTNSLLVQKSQFPNQKPAEVGTPVDIYLPPISNNVDNYIQHRKVFSKGSNQSTRSFKDPQNYHSQDFTALQPVIQDMLVEDQRRGPQLIQTSDLAQKVRDLHLQMIDMQGSQDRRISILNEQLNAKIERALVNLEAKHNNQQS